MSAPSGNARRAKRNTRTMVSMAASAMKGPFPLSVCSSTVASYRSRAGTGSFLPLTRWHEASRKRLVRSNRCIALRRRWEHRLHKSDRHRDAAPRNTTDRPAAHDAADRSVNVLATVTANATATDLSGSSLLRAWSARGTRAMDAACRPVHSPAARDHAGISAYLRTPCRPASRSASRCCAGLRR